MSFIEKGSFWYQSCFEFIWGKNTPRASRIYGSKQTSSLKFVKDFTSYRTPQMKIRNRQINITTQKKNVAVTTTNHRSAMLSEASTDKDAPPLILSTQTCLLFIPSCEAQIFFKSFLLTFFRPFLRNDFKSLLFPPLPWTTWFLFVPWRMSKM